jgi:hypothetical protein
MRVYLNRFEDAPLIWSVDQGTKATEQRFAQVIFAGVNGVTNWNLLANNVDDPRCWIEVFGGTLTVENDVATIGGFIYEHAGSEKAEALDSGGSEASGCADSRG